MEVTTDGELRRIRYGIDYVFVDGPGSCRPAEESLD
jgi:hypothetical protein